VKKERWRIGMVNIKKMKEDVAIYILPRNVRAREKKIVSDEQKATKHN